MDRKDGFWWVGFANYEGAGGAPFSMVALTQSDMVFGTPEYMAPEQAMGQTLDERADLAGYHPDVRVFEVLEADGSPAVSGTPTSSSAGGTAGLDLLA